MTKVKAILFSTSLFLFGSLSGVTTLALDNAPPKIKTKKLPPPPLVIKVPASLLKNPSSRSALLSIPEAALCAPPIAAQAESPTLPPEVVAQNPSLADIDPSNKDEDYEYVLLESNPESPLDQCCEKLGISEFPSDEEPPEVTAAELAAQAIAPAKEIKRADAEKSDAENGNNVFQRLTSWLINPNMLD